VSGLSRKNPEVFRYSVDLGLILSGQGGSEKSRKSFQDAIDGLRVSEEKLQVRWLKYFIFNIKTIGLSAHMKPIVENFRLCESSIFL
jgi:hypothetical protein